MDQFIGLGSVFHDDSYHTILKKEEFDIDDILRHAIVVPEGQKLIVF